MGAQDEGAGRARGPTDFQKGRKYFACKLIKRYLGINTGFPHYTGHYLAAHIERAGVERAELEEYRGPHSKLLRSVQLAMIISSLIYFSRLIVMPLILFKELDFTDPEANLRWHTSEINQFACLLSNCSRARVAPRALAERLSSLPLFSICHPRLSFLPNVTQFLAIDGAIMATFASFSCLLSGLALPLILELMPAGNSFLMFMVAPRATRRLVEERARQLTESLEESFLNHYANHLRNETGGDLEDGERDVTSLESGWSQLTANGEHASLAPSLSDPLARFVCLPLEASWRGPADPAFDSWSSPQLFNTPRSGLLSSRSDEWRFQCEPPLSAEAAAASANNSPDGPNRTSSKHALALEDAAHDCVSIMRSSWWHSMASSTFFWLCLMGLLNMLLLAFIFCLILFDVVRQQVESTEAFGRDSRSWNCSLWLGLPKERTIVRPIDFYPLDRLEMGLVLGDALLLIIQSIWPFVCTNIFLLIFILTNVELLCWLYELELGLTLAVEFVRQLCGRAPPGPAARRRPESARPQVHFDMESIRYRFSHLVRLRALLITHKRLGSRLAGTHSRLESELATEQFVAHNIRLNEMGPEAAVELLQKLYIGFRIFVEHVHECGPLVTAMLTFINLYNYTVVTIVVLLLRSVKNAVVLPLLILSIGWIIANSIVLIAANLQTKVSSLGLAPRAAPAPDALLMPIFSPRPPSARQKISRRSSGICSPSPAAAAASNCGTSTRSGSNR